MDLRPQELEFVVETGARDAGDRLDRVLSTRAPDLSRSRIQALIRGGHVTVDGRPAKPKDPVHPPCRIRVVIPPPAAAEAAPEALPLRILHADDDLAVVDKEPGMVVHPGSGNPDGTLVNALLHRFGALSSVGGISRPGIVHRLDKDTSGCLVVALNDFTHERLAAMFSQRQVTKHYLAVVHGHPSPKVGTIENRIGRNPGNRQKMAIVPAPAGKPAVTRYRVLGSREKTSLVMCDLLTGRTHQIRVHLKGLGHPLLGDVIYGRGAAQQPVDRLMLHAWRLAFAHPRTGAAMRFEAPIPQAFDPWVAAAGALPDWNESPAPGPGGA